MKLKLIELRLFYTRERGTKTYMRKLKPKRQDARAIQLLIGRQLLAIEDVAMYYYVVGVVRLPDGKLGYRTIIGKTMMGDDTLE